MVETPLPPPPPGARPHDEVAPPDAGRPVWELTASWPPATTATASRAAGGPPPGAGEAPPSPPTPPERAVRGDGPARSVAATVVGAVGALLLLAAAATFLAVSWDAVPVPARVALVGAATAAAIGGGAALRRRLPAVGAVVFHLGVLLVPVDVLGLCLQLDAGRATTWIAVGAATVTVLPLAGTRGRAPLLGALGLLGVPVLATGLADGLAVLPDAPLLVAAAAALVAVVGWPGTRDPWRAAAAPALAVGAVAGPVVVAAVAAVVGAAGGAPLVTATAAGWVPASWVSSAVGGTIGVATVAALAVARRSTRLAVLVVPLAGAALLAMVLAGDAPRLALLLPAPLLFVGVQVGARLAAGDPLFAAPTRTVALTAEALASLTLPAALTVAVLGDVAVDVELAVATSVTALGWTLAAVRRRGAADAVGLPLVGGAAVITLAAAAALAGIAVAAPLLLAGALLTLALRADGSAGPVATLVGLVLGAAAHAAVLTTVRDLGIAVGEAAVADAAAALVAAAGAVAIAVRLDQHLRAGADAVTAAALLLPWHLLAVALSATAVAGDALLGTGLDPVAAGGAVAVVLLLAGAALLDRPAVVGDVLRATAAFVAGVVVVAPFPADALADAAVALPAATIVAVWLTADLRRTGRTWLAWLVGPVAVRAVAGGAWLVVGTRVGVGVALVAAATVAGAVALLAPRVRAAAATSAALAAVVGVGLLAVSAHAVALTLLLLGLATAAVGLVTRVPLVAHLGGLTAVVGAWWLTDLEGVTALDVWAAPLAAYLFAALIPARRAGRLSSWTADVPPLLLVVVPALLERADGGGGWHAVAAGVLGVAAVIGGGVGRHAGPLVVGTLTVVTVVAIETLAVVAAVPTWAWLTLGGLTLLGAAVLIERTGDPVEGVRRVRDVLAERFD